jgi:TRAP-type mannitol/chloroaromatic compound transport system permease small subunit
VLYLHSTVFLCAAGWALGRDAHVRVDIFYRKMTPAGRNWVDLLGGALLLLPACAVIAAHSWPFVADSWRVLETSQDPGGIPAVFLLKTLVPVYCALVALQGLAGIARSALALRGTGEGPPLS